MTTRSTASKFSLSRYLPDPNKELEDKIAADMCTSEADLAIRESYISRLRAKETLVQQNLENRRFKETFKDLASMRNKTQFYSEMKRLAASPVWGELENKVYTNILPATKNFLINVRNLSDEFHSVTYDELKKLLRISLIEILSHSRFYMTKGTFLGVNSSVNIDQLPSTRQLEFEEILERVLVEKTPQIFKMIFRESVKDKEIAILDSEVFGKYSVDDYNRKTILQTNQTLNPFQRIKILMIVTKIMEIDFFYVMGSIMLEDFVLKLRSYKALNMYTEREVFAFMEAKRIRNYILPNFEIGSVAASKGDFSLQKWIDYVQEVDADLNEIYDRIFEVEKRVRFQFDDTEHDLDDHPAASSEQVQHAASFSDNPSYEAFNEGDDEDDGGTGGGLDISRSRVSKFDLRSVSDKFKPRKAAHLDPIIDLKKKQVKGGELTTKDKTRLSMLEAYIKTGGNSLRSMAEYQQLKKKS